ncbi:MAG: hypothetical protein Q7S29_04720 [Candidatus Peribacter sp.]|nr:hypothetical protein [Candidatus Peribacter sp.]
MEWEEIAATYAEDGDVRGVLRNYIKAKKQAPKDVLIRCGDNAVLRKRYEDAIKAYQYAPSKPKLRALRKHLIDTDNPIRAEKVSAILVQMTSDKYR